MPEAPVPMPTRFNLSAGALIDAPPTRYGYTSSQPIYIKTNNYDFEYYLTPGDGHRSENRSILT
jgi:hypothetical protein